MARNYVYELDNSAIIHLATLCKTDSNVYRIEVRLSQAPDPALLQQALDRVAPRFPAIAAGIWQGWFRCGLVPVRQIPVRPDPGVLITMTRAEIDRCALRIYYGEDRIIGEFFHSLSDGTGAGIFIKTLVAEYLRLRHGITMQDPGILPLEEEPAPSELVDDFFTYAGGRKASLGQQHSYQIPGKAPQGARTQVIRQDYDALAVKNAARRYGVTVNTLLTAVMFRAVAQVSREDKTGKKRPIRLMVPINLRRMFPSTTLRNFSYFALPGVTEAQGLAPMKELVVNVQSQLAKLCTKEAMQAAITTNTSLDRNPFFRIIPLPLKRIILRQANLLLGAKASCMSLTNLGVLSMPPEAAPYVQEIRYMLTPRTQSPYNCTVSTFGNTTGITFTCLNNSAGLEHKFRENMEQILSES